MLNRLSLAAPALLLLLLSGCSHAADEAIAKQITHPGVYALTSSGLSEITTTGAETFDAISQEIQFKFEQAITPSAVPLGFVTNVPNAVISQSKVFLLPSLDVGHWHKYFADVNDTKPIPSSADAISGSIYKITPELPSPATGYLCLWVKMPTGNDDRMYAIHLP